MADSTSEFQPYQPHHEKTPSQESAKIPENWKFQERSNPNLNIIQLEPDSNFLAFNYQYKRNPTDAFYRQENRDYFFDTNGNITHYCGRSKKPGASIGITADGIKSVYVINPNEGLGWILFPNSEDREEDFPSFLRGDIVYDLDGRLLGLGMNDLFVKDKRSGIITSPTFSIHREKGESKDEWKFEIDEPTESSSDPNEFRTRRNFESNFLFKTLEKTDNSGNLDVFDDKGENVFHIEYGGDDSAMFIAQTHIPTGITKKIRALKSPDNQAVTAAINALPPYNRQQGSDIKPLVVPWRDINRILGAGISYSYPQSPISDRNTTADAPRSPKD